MSQANHPYSVHPTVLKKAKPKVFLLEPPNNTDPHWFHIYLKYAKNLFDEFEPVIYEWDVEDPDEELAFPTKADLFHAINALEDIDEFLYRPSQFVSCMGLLTIFLDVARYNGIEAIEILDVEQVNNNESEVRIG